MSIDSAVSILWDVLKYVIVPIKRQFGYVMSSKSYALDLEKEVGKLAYEAEMVQNAVEVARNNLRNVYSHVAQWQVSAEKALKEARDLLDDFEKATKTCCYGSLPDPNCRYQFSRKAKHMIEDIQRLAQECSQFKDISSSGPAPGNVAASTPARREGKVVVQSTAATAFASLASMSIKLKDDDIFKSRELIMREIMAALADKNNSVVGIYGMGGVGKSTLLADVERRIRKEKSFDWVAKADVSENQDIKRIQGEIAHALKLDMKDAEYVNSRAERLRARLEDEVSEKKKVLIILDNLWKGLDLKSVGIPCGHDNKVIGCKLLLTSRDRDVLRRGMGCDRDFHLDALKEEEGKRLFERTVGDKVHDDPFKSLVDKALHKCAGLPFLIIAMANIFKDAKFPEWRDVLRQIEMSTNKGISEQINEMLQLSYDRLKGEDGKEAKSLLRLCVVYGVSKPSLENLVRYGVGSRLFREDSSMEEVRDRLSSLIRTLKASSLLLADDEDVDGFKIHDLVRGFVASVASRDDPLLVLKDNDKSVTDLPKDKLKSCTAICFPYVDMKELPEELDCPEMQIFLLFTNNESLKVPNSYFSSMRKLMVLHLSQVRLTRSPSPFKFLEDLHTLCLDGCLLEDVAMIGELKGLHVLSFVNSKVQRLPKEIGQLVELRLLDLNHCSRLEIIEPGVLGSLIKLEELYMENSFDRWNAVEQSPPTNAMLIELNNMKNLYTLHVSILDPSVLPEDLNVKKLTKYKIQIGYMLYWPSQKGSSTLQLKLEPTSDILHKGCIQTFLGKTDDVFLDGLGGIDHSICALSQEGFRKLKHLHAENSPSVYYVLQSPPHTDFKKLESLVLKNLINLEKICNNHISSKSLSALKVVRVESCDKMEVLFPLSLLKELPQLEEIRVVMCHLMQEIVQVDDCGKVELSNLHVLELRDLRNIKNFFTAGTAASSSTSKDQVGTQVAFFNGQQVSIPSLESLTMVGLPNLEDIWTDESPLGLSNLQFLKVSSCKSISKVIYSRSLANLHKLHTLEVEACVSVQEIFDLDGLGANANIETLSELSTINIDDLPSLRHIWNKNPCGIVRFHNLKQLRVSGCNNLVFLFLPSVVQSLSQLRELKVLDCKKMEAILMEEEGLRTETLVFPMLTNLVLASLESLTCFSRRECSREAQSEDCVKSCSTTLFNQEVAFPSLETLDIYGMDNIEIIWDNQVAAESFHKLKSLSVYQCNKLVNIVPSCILGRLKSLESLDVRSCGSLEVVFNLQPLNPLDGHPIARFPLKKLNLDGLPELKCVWDKELHSQVKFQCLHSVTISRCKSLASLFPASVAIHLTQLEELEINECGIVELIEKEGPVLEAVFPKLTSLQLKYLTELKCIYTGTHALRWPALKTLEVHGCNKVETLASQPNNEMPLHKQPLFLIEKGAFPNLEELKLDLFERMEIWNGHFHDGEFFCKLRVVELHHCSQESAISTYRFVQSLTNLEKLVVCKSYLEELSIIMKAIEGPSHEQKVLLPFSRFYQNLKTLDVSRCDGSSNMFTSTIVGNLVKLTKLRISNCKKLTEVICDEGGEEGLVLAFNQLKYMELDGLTGLRCFSSIKYTLKFPLLEDVIVSGCPSMKFFSRGPIEAPKLERVQVSTEAWFWKGDLNITIQNMFEEMATVAGIEFLWLSEFPELIGKWHSELNPIKLSWQLQSLTVDKCPSFINVIPSRLMLLLHNVRRLQVHDCESLEEIFDLEGLKAVESTRVLPRLRYLDLVNLPKLRRLWNNDLQGTLRFNSIFSLTLYNCGNLTHAFTPSMAQSLANLWWMEIKECGQMEGVIAEEEGQGSLMEKITFLNLRWMELECLPNLTSFLSVKNHTLDCPKIEYLTIAHCPNMRSLTWQSLTEIDHHTPSLFTLQVQIPWLQSMVLSHMDNLSKIWTDNPRDTLTFEHLRQVKVDNCNSLENLFPHWVATSLTQLEELRVESCGIEEIVASGDDTSQSATAQFLFPQLTTVVFHDMPQLKSFYPNLPTLTWPFLKELRVTHCDKLNMLSFAASMNKWAQRNDQRDLLDHEAHFSFERDIPTLERLLLVDKDIQMIQNGKFSDDIFGKPKAVTLACFHDERAAFPPIFLLQRFQNLQSLEVFCSSFEDLFPDEGLVGEGKHPVLENLRELKLSKLHKLKRVWREDYLVAKILQSIDKFEVWDCPGLTTLFPAVTSFKNLTQLVVKNSSGFVHLVTVSAVTNLVHLTGMTIIGCEKMKEVVANDVDEEGKVISLGRLTWLTLQQLPNLLCFSSTISCSFRFPSLFQIKVASARK
ncbi:uncharacterized protein LOC115691305 isoform X1 [Syzygium oleosum]|uniref:uncharacterized protein LOC115691305 isoform X1 n=1 Tax=Syzygium oleosum TaxID=219896 RepID=UPI0024BAA897|nr:uncharacterized protein LOC115691305 isoform X1 [Syzygium oleosum]